jgi:hypothetical protein
VDPNLEDAYLIELEKTVRGEKLHQIYDALEPRAMRLVDQQSAVSYVILFGALFGFAGLLLGFFANTTYGLPWILIAILTSFLIAIGMALGNLISIGWKGLALERKARNLKAFLKPILPILGQTNQTKEIKEVKKQLSIGVQKQIEHEMGNQREKADKQLLLVKKPKEDDSPSI